MAGATKREVKQRSVDMNNNTIEKHGAILTFNPDSVGKQIVASAPLTAGAGPSLTISAGNANGANTGGTLSLNAGTGTPNGNVDVGAGGAVAVRVGAAASTVGFFGSVGTVKPTITGSRGGNAALASLLTALAAMNLIVDSTTA